jgi:hypothetical protein
LFIERCRAVRRLGAAALAGGGAWLAMLTTVAPVWAQAACPSMPPPFQVLRYEEDYRDLEHPECRTEWWDHVKYIRLVRDARSYVSLGGSARLRYEYFHNALWGLGPQDSDGFLLQRYLLHGDLHIPYARLFVEFESSLENGRQPEPRPIDENKLDVNQLFGDLRLPLGGVATATLRVGRQELSFGSERLVSPREGPNIRQSFDVVRLILEAAGWRADGFVSRPVKVKPDIFDDTKDPTRVFWGVYAVGSPFGRGQGLDLYYLGFDHDDATFDQGTADEQRHTVGTRLWGRFGAADYNTEFLYQFGTFGRGDIQAWAASADVGYTLARAPGRPRLGLKTEINSGDRDPKSPDLRTLNGLFPKGNYFGEMALLGPVNVIDAHPSVDFVLPWGLRLVLDWTVFWRQSVRDGIYSPPGQLLRSGRASRARFVGHQPGAKLEWRFDRHLTATVVYNHFFTGDFIKETGPSRDIDFVAAWVTYRF